MKDRSKYNEKEMFRVPENYFEDLTSGIMQKAVSQKKVTRPGLFAVTRPHLMLAASMIILVVLSYTTLRFILPGAGENYSPEKMDEISEYLAYEIDEASLIETIRITDEAYYNSEIAGNISDEEIIEYLANQDINYEELIENL